MRETYKKVAIVSILLLGGCSVHPLPEDMTNKATIDIVDHVRCEALSAVINQMAKRLEEAKLEKTTELARQFEERIKTGNVYLENEDAQRILTAFGSDTENVELKRLAEFEQWIIGYTFDFQINHELKNSGGATFSVPFSNGSFGLAIKSGLHTTRDAQRNFKMADTFKELGEIKRCRTHDPRQNELYPITGNVGLAEVVDTYLTLYNSRGKVFEFTDVLTFTTVISGGIDPTIEITPVTNNFKLTAANLSRSNTRTDLHRLTVSLNPPSGSKIGVIENLIRQQDLEAFSGRR